SAKEIARETNIDRRLADELAREIQVKILAPIIPEIQKLYHYSSDAAADSTPPPPSTPVPMRPSFARPSASESATTPPTPPVNPDTPFILHEEQKEIEQTRPRDETLVRPSFYEGADIRHQTLDTGTERAAARLEIGGVEGDQIKGPRVGRTEEPQIRVVHYTGPQTPVDPFGPSVSPEQEKPAEPAKPSQDVHPENIVDLKDLPK
ncbi:MAG: hypothetical protein HYW38_02240, partial [Candidatus Colwellbacteria bacterium]|nr:hypothetical protein [Candidatus Colwellbacteria bacterium]